MSLISVIMPAYNCEKYIEKAIDSILNQSYTNIEFLIADDCSTDNTWDVINAYKERDSRIMTFHNQKNQGYLKTTNLLFEKCNGKFITFQDADDWSKLNRIEKLVSVLEDDKDIGCVGSFVNRVDEMGKEKSKIIFRTDYKDIYNDLPECFNCIGSALMVRREVLNKCGNYNIFFDRIGSEDLYWYGLIVSQFKTINLPEYLYYYRDTPYSISNEKNMSVKRQASKDMAIEAFSYYLKYKEEIFHYKRALNAMRFYVFGKYYFWNTQYKKGVRQLLLSLFMSPCRANKIFKLLYIYIPKLLLRQSVE